MGQTKAIRVVNFLDALNKRIREAQKRSAVPRWRVKYGNLPEEEKPEMSMSGYYEQLFQTYGYPSDTDMGWVGDVNLRCDTCDWPMHKMPNHNSCANCEGKIPGKNKKRNSPYRFDTQPLLFWHAGNINKFDPYNLRHWCWCYQEYFIRNTTKGLADIVSLAKKKGRWIIGSDDETKRNEIEDFVMEEILTIGETLG